MRQEIHDMDLGSQSVDIGAQIIDLGTLVRGRLFSESQSNGDARLQKRMLCSLNLWLDL